MYFGGIALFLLAMWMLGGDKNERRDKNMLQTMQTGEFAIARVDKEWRRAKYKRLLYKFNVDSVQYTGYWADTDNEVALGEFYAHWAREDEDAGNYLIVYDPQDPEGLGKAVLRLDCRIQSLADFDVYVGRIRELREKGEIKLGVEVMTGQPAAYESWRP